MKKYNDTVYLVNTFGKEIFLPDIKKRIPFNEFEYEIFALDGEVFNDSQDVKECIRARMIQDVTEQVLAKLTNDNNEQSQQGKQTTVKVEKASLSNPQTIKSSSKDKEELYIVSDLDSSRALSGGDREERIRNLEKGQRTGKKQGVLIDEYETEELMQKAKDKRESFIVEGDTRANPTFDPRFKLNQNTDINLKNIDIEISPAALQKKNEYLEKQAKYVRQNADSEYWKNSSIGRERMAAQQAKLKNKQQNQRISDIRIKEANSNPEINPLFSENFENQIVSETIDPNDTFNPLLHDILAEDAITEVQTKVKTNPVNKTTDKQKKATANKKPNTTTKTSKAKTSKAKKKTQKN